MKLPGEEESGGMGHSVIYMLVGVGAFILIILLFVLKSNEENQSGSAYLQQLQQQQEQEQEEAQQEETEIAAEEEQEKKLRAEDLDFWDMYPVEDEKDENTPDRKENSEETNPHSTYEEKAEQDRKEQEERKEQESPETDGKHTLVTNLDGTEEWVLISPYLTKNTYDFTKLEEKAGLRRYMENGRNTSYVGVDLSKHDGEVNFTSLKAAGVNYVMIRLGSRGYSTGAVTLDDNFKTYMDGALGAGLDVGVYFASQAISQEEATQEVNFVVQNLAPYQGRVKYPIAFDMEYPANDKARIDGLSRDDKTTIAVTFLEGIKAAGYTPMLYGNKEWLIKEVDLTKLQNFDVWLSQESDMPDYPYQFTMWQYTTDGVVNGIPGDANLNISFVGYSER